MVPLHPSVVHVPLALAFVLPLLVLAFAFMIRAGKMSAQSWLIVMGLQILTVGGGYLALETGETDEHLVEKVVSKKIIHEHEEAAEVFVGVSVIALVLSVGAFFLRKDLQLSVHLVVFVVTAIAAFLGFRSGKLGGELVYVHGAASAHQLASQESSGILPTPGQNTSESPFPVDENESLKVDDHDYQGTESSIEVEALEE